MQTIASDANLARRRATRGARRDAFTLVEMMAVVVIIALLGTLVATAVSGRIDQARVTTAQTQIRQIEQALDFYQIDNGRYPNTDQGLEALIRKPSIEPVPSDYRPGGYLRKRAIPRDPWDQVFEYRSPGVENPHGFDLWSHGRDGQPGGEGVDADVVNWADESIERG